MNIAILIVKSFIAHSAVSMCELINNLKHIYCGIT